MQSPGLAAKWLSPSGYGGFSTAEMPPGCVVCGQVERAAGLLQLQQKLHQGGEGRRSDHGALEPLASLIRVPLVPREETHRAGPGRTDCALDKRAGAGQDPRGLCSRGSAGRP